MENTKEITVKELPEVILKLNKITGKQFYFKGTGRGIKLAQEYPRDSVHRAKPIVYTGVDFKSTGCRSRAHYAVRKYLESLK